MEYIIVQLRKRGYKKGFGNANEIFREIFINELSEYQNIAIIEMPLFYLMSFFAQTISHKYFCAILIHYK